MRRASRKCDTHPKPARGREQPAGQASRRGWLSPPGTGSAAARQHGHLLIFASADSKWFNSSISRLEALFQDHLGSVDSTKLGGKHNSVWNSFIEDLCGSMI